MERWKNGETADSIVTQFWSWDFKNRYKAKMKYLHDIYDDEDFIF